VNFYRAPLSFLSAPKYQDSCDLVPLNPRQVAQRNFPLSRAYRSFADDPGAASNLNNLEGMSSRPTRPRYPEAIFGNIGT
jgi:hypothetical protein